MLLLEKREREGGREGGREREREKERGKERERARARAKGERAREIERKIEGEICVCACVRVRASALAFVRGREEGRLGCAACLHTSKHRRMARNNAYGDVNEDFNITHTLSDTF